MADLSELNVTLFNMGGNKKSNPGDRRSSTPSGEGGARRESTPSAEAGGETKPSRVSNNSEDTSSYEEEGNTVAESRRKLIIDILDTVSERQLVNLFILCQDANDGTKKTDFD